MNCVNCGSFLEENADVCSQCGQPVSAAGAPEPMQQMLVASLKGLTCPSCGSPNLTVKGVKGSLGKAVATGSAFGAIGNLVAGSNAKKNTETQPLEYKCTGCGNKFVSPPLIAAPEDILPAPCTIIYERPSSILGAAVPQIPYLNGIKIGAVKNGRSMTFQTYNRYNMIFVTDQFGVAFPCDYKFEAQPGGTVTVRFNRKFK